MFGNLGRRALGVVAGTMLIGSVGAGAVYAQGPQPQAAPVRQAATQAVRGWRWGGTMPQVWADALGISVDELTAAVQSGKSVADLAAEKGVSVDSLVEKAVAVRQAKVQEAVEAGRLTQAQADAMLAQMRTRVTENLQNGTCTPGANQLRLGLGAGADNGLGLGLGLGNCPFGNAS